MTELFRRIFWLLNRHRAERELAEEMDAHRAESEADGHRNPAFGSTLRHVETTREVWGWTWIDRLFQDLRYALRLLRKSPSFTITALLVIALGVGVNLTAFRLLLLEITPTVRDPDTLVELARWFPDGSGNTIAWPVLCFLRPARPFVPRRHRLPRRVGHLRRNRTRPRPGDCQGELRNRIVLRRTGPAPDPRARSRGVR